MTLNFEQRRDHHAIGQFDASLVFFRSLSATAFARAVSELENYAKENDLPVPINRQVIQFNFSGHSQVDSTPPQQAGWQRFASNGEIEMVVVLDDNSILFSCRKYETWEKMMPRIIEVFSRLSRHFLIEVPAITRFQVNYANEFRCTSEVFNSGQEIFRTNTPWLVPAIANTTDAWHSNCGQFESVTKMRRRLVNIQCASRRQGDPSFEHSISFVEATLSVAEAYDIPGESPLIVPLETVEEVLTGHFDAAHSREKELLRELISDDYLQLMKVK